jgi:hypothetical protein
MQTRTKGGRAVIAALLATNVGCYSSWDMTPRALAPLNNFHEPSRVQLADADGKGFTFDKTSQLSFEGPDTPFEKFTEISVGGGSFVGTTPDARTLAIDLGRRQIYGELENHDAVARSFSKENRYDGSNACGAVMTGKYKDDDETEVMQGEQFDKYKTERGQFQAPHIPPNAPQIPSAPQPPQSLPKKSNALVIALIVVVVTLAMALSGTAVALFFVLRDKSDDAPQDPRAHQYDYAPVPTATPPTATTTTTSAPQSNATATTPKWTTPTPTEDVGKPPRSGSYFNGGDESMPHYIVTLSVPSHGRVNGTLTYQYQNGTLANELTFSGTTRFGVATVTTNTGHNLTMGFGDNGIDFGFGCIGVFRLAQSHAECMFQLSEGQN